MITKIVLGSGPESQKQPETLRIDIVQEWCDKVCDVAKEKLPVKDNSIEYLEAFHIAEHIQLNEDFLHFMKEIHRVLKKDGIAEITVPHKDCHSAWECYQHTRFFNENSFVNFYNNPYHKEMGTPIFKCLVAEKRPHGDGVEVHVVLTKD